MDRASSKSWIGACGLLLFFNAAAQTSPYPAWAAEAARCPSKWGADDQRGTMNLQTPAQVLKAARLVKTGKIYELGMELNPRTTHTAGRRFEMITLRSAGPTGITGRISNEEQVVTNLGQVGTDIDGYSHVAMGDSYYNCFKGNDIATRTGFKKLGIENVGTIFTRGVLIDVAAAKGTTSLPPYYEITIDDLQRALKEQGSHIEPGDAVLINVGWDALNERQRTQQYSAGTPGLGEQAALWLAKQDPILVGSDNDAVERFSIKEAEDPAKVSLPVHQIMLTVYGIHILENMHLAELARDRAYEFLFVTQPLKMVGATGSTVAPSAIR